MPGRPSSVKNVRRSRIPKEDRRGILADTKAGEFAIGRRCERKGKTSGERSTARKPRKITARRAILIDRTRAAFISDCYFKTPDADKTPRNTASKKKERVKRIEEYRRKKNLKVKIERIRKCIRYWKISCNNGGDLQWIRTHRISRQSFVDSLSRLVLFQKSTRNDALLPPNLCPSLAPCVSKEFSGEESKVTTSSGKLPPVPKDLSIPALGRTRRWLSLSLIIGDIAFR